MSGKNGRLPEVRERADADPALPLMSPAREKYARLRAGGMGKDRAAGQVGTHPRTAKSWEDPKRGDLARAVVGRINHLRSVAAAAMPSPQDMLGAMYDAAGRALEDGKYDAHFKYMKFLHAELSRANDTAIPTIGEDMTDEALEKELG